MASLTEVYEGHLRTVTTSKRVTVGASLFAVGAAMVVGSISVATTTVGAQLGLDQVGARRLAGVLAGLGLPATLLGVLTVLPAGRATRAASVIGASVTGFGVALFWVAYPDQWFGAGDPLATVTAVVYFVGAMTTLSCLFAALATFKTRKKPGGTARMEITEEGGVRLVEEADPVPTSRFGSVGLFGSDPKGEVDTQTNREGRSSSTMASRQRGTDAEILSDSAGSHGGATADGGSRTVDETRDVDATDDAMFLDVAEERGRPDAYCGNCEHFEYVKVDEKITPYCGYHDELMDDMDACEQWSEST